jgi:hypothetical protein
MKGLQNLLFALFENSMDKDLTPLPGKNTEAVRQEANKHPMNVEDPGADNFLFKNDIYLYMSG